MQLNAGVRRHWRHQMIEAHTTGIILDRGHPQLYVVLTLDATEKDADSTADADAWRQCWGRHAPLPSRHERRSNGGH
ncbi:MAG TPA: hypothetical protein VFW04_08985 [Gemmatimonadaceae bacterium]|nr:hypothetical protein [Gemmatimonadaceae bacterium]